MSELTQVLRHLVPYEDPDALVDASTGDDAAVYRLADDRALVVSVDFFTPIVDDPRDFGRIGAANALSDLYAMGAKPLFALNLVAFPRSLLEEGLLGEILEGGGEVCAEAGIAVLGGHSVDDAEPKFGMVVIGEAHPGRLITNTGARAGDRLVLTKPLGTGIVATAHKADAAPDAVLKAAVASMSTLNRDASRAMSELGLRAGTDVTGYGLLGHLHRMLLSSGVSAEIEVGSVPRLPGISALIGAGHVPGGTRRNLDDLEEHVSFAEGIDETDRILLADAQTSGGLLMAVPSGRLDELLDRLSASGTPGSPIGRVMAGRPGSITVLA